MVILPFMKHGDLHAFLLASRIGENPFVSVWGGSGQEEVGLENRPGEGQGFRKRGAWWFGPLELLGRGRASFSLMKPC
jgi:hypothetical protein